MGRGRSVEEGDGARGFSSRLDTHPYGDEFLGADGEADAGDEGGEVAGGEVVLAEGVGEGGEVDGREGEGAVLDDAR